MRTEPDYIALAKDLHNGQFRRDGVTPYFNHLENVANAFEPGSLAWKVALLHDSVEDSLTTEIMLQHVGVPDSVIRRVAMLARQPDEFYYDFIRRLLSDDVCVAVKLADIADNMSDAPTKRQRQKYANALRQIALAVSRQNGQTLDYQ